MPQAAFRLRDAERMREAVAAVAEVTGEWRLPTCAMVRGLDALLAGRRPDAIREFPLPRGAYRDQQDVTNEALAAIGLVAALGEDTPEGQAEADELRAALRELHAHWLLQWLDDVGGQVGADACRRRAAGTAPVG